MTAPEVTGDAPAKRNLTATGHVAALEGVRGVAILVVLIHNAVWLGDNPPSFPLASILTVTSTGWIGVQLFFVLSGFLITGILVDSLGSPSFFRTFYARRTLRIFPLYYAFLAFAFLVFPRVVHFPGWASDVAKYQWWYWTYQSNWINPFGLSIPGLTHFWSLAVEEQFYLFWPLLVFTLSRRRLLQLCLVVIAATPFVRFAMRLTDLPINTGYEFTFARWDALACGAVIALLLRGAGGRAWLERYAGRGLQAALLALVVLVAVERDFHSNTLGVQVLGQTLVAVLSAALVYHCVVPASSRATSLQRAMSARWLRFLGKYSYALYVFHVPIHYAVTKIDADLLSRGDPRSRFATLVAHVLTVSALSIVAAMVSWRVLEKPCLDLKERLAPRRSARLSPEVATGSG